ncbi:MAG: hypothetical protein AAFQ22_07095 [Pseudomonadota bacterium]
MTEAQLQAMKAVVWEEAKGKLLALVALEGHRRLTTDADLAAVRFDDLNRAVENIIHEIESDELHC